MCHESKVLHCTLHASILCQLEICIGLRQFWAANLAAAAVACLRLLLLLLLLLRMLTPVLVCGSVASGMRCLLNTPRMVMVN